MKTHFGITALVRSLLFATFIALAACAPAPTPVPTAVPPTAVPLTLAPATAVPPTLAPATVAPTAEPAMTPTVLLSGATITKSL